MSSRFVACTLSISPLPRRRCGRFAVLYSDAPRNPANGAARARRAAIGRPRGAARGAAALDLPLEDGGRRRAGDGERRLCRGRLSRSERERRNAEAAMYVVCACACACERMCVHACIQENGHPQGREGRLYSYAGRQAGRRAGREGGRVGTRGGDAREIEGGSTAPACMQANARGHRMAEQASSRSHGHACKAQGA